MAGGCGMTNKSAYLFLYISISNACAIDKRGRYENNVFDKSACAEWNLDKLLNSSLHVDVLHRFCGDCEYCKLCSNLYKGSTIDNVCVINALLIHNNIKHTKRR